MNTIATNNITEYLSNLKKDDVVNMLHMVRPTQCKVIKITKTSIMLEVGIGNTTMAFDKENGWEKNPSPYSNHTRRILTPEHANQINEAESERHLRRDLVKEIETVFYNKSNGHGDCSIQSEILEQALALLKQD